MTREPSTAALTQTRDGHLRANEKECIKRNIIVHVDSINKTKNVAYCSVGQRKTGLFHRTYEVSELVWRAHHALTPLIDGGITPLVTARHASSLNTTVAPPTQVRDHFMDAFSEFQKWLGYPAHEEFSKIALVQDPFGWHQAMLASEVTSEEERFQAELQHSLRIDCDAGVHEAA
jgi:hypothetical protein